MNNLLIMFSALVLLFSFWILGVLTAYKFPRLSKSKALSLEAYAITMTEDAIPRLGLILQSDGKESRFFVDAPYALKLADELTMAAVRAAPKSSNAQVLQVSDKEWLHAQNEFESLKA